MQTSRRKTRQPAASGLRARKKQEVRERILSVCGRLFRARGFDETTVDDIIGKVGVSRQTFFNYFAGKDAVLAELGLVWLREQAEMTRRRRRFPRRAALRGACRRLPAGDVRLRGSSHRARAPDGQDASVDGIRHRRLLPLHGITRR